MTLRLTTVQAERLHNINSGDCRGNYKARQPHTGKTKITPEQVTDVKRYVDKGWTSEKIQQTTGLSEYHVRGVKQNRYNHLVEDTNGN